MEETKRRGWFEKTGTESFKTHHRMEGGMGVDCAKIRDKMV